MEKKRNKSIRFFILAIAFIAACGSDDEGTPPPPPEPEMPVVTTNPVAAPGESTAIVGGIVVSDGGATITRRGVCWGFNPLPTLNDNVEELGTGTGAFSTTLTGLSGTTTYYARAFAENIAGLSYGEARSFTTISGSGGNLFTPGSGVTDAGGKAYSTVIINGKEWMGQNLATQVFANGDSIAQIEHNPGWNAADTAAWASYLNTAELAMTYGYLYNQYAVADPRGLCPTGWHVPDIAEYISLIDFLGGELQAGGKMKETGVQLWTPPNLGANNTSGLAARPGGIRGQFGGFVQIGVTANWWTSSLEAGAGVSILLSYESAAVAANTFPRQYGLSVRCVKD